MSLLLLSLLGFAAGSLLIAAVAVRVQQLVPSVLTDSDPREGWWASKTAAPILLLGALHKKPRLEKTLKTLEQRLIELGEPMGLRSGSRFLALAEVVGLGAASLALLLLALAGRLTVLSLFPIALVAAATAGALVFWLRIEVADRRRAIGRQLPFFLDLGVMAMGSGAGFLEVLEIYQRDCEDEALAEEFQSVIAEVRMGRPLREALEAMRSRIPLDTLQSTIDAVLQAQTLGTPLVDVLADQADVMRFRRSQAAERAAEELKVRLQLPVMMMMMSVFLLILGPAVMKIMDSGILR